jgi:hypothetical protein
VLRDALERIRILTDDGQLSETVVNGAFELADKAIQFTNAPKVESLESQVEKAVDDMLTTGMGIVRISPNEFYKEGEQEEITFPLSHEGCDSFWKYWNENGETHKHGYYESTWGAIRAYLETAAVTPDQRAAGEQEQEGKE